MNIVHIRCQWKLRDIRLERRVPYKESRDIGEREKRWDHASSKFLVFQNRFSLSAHPREDRRIHYIYIIRNIYSKITATLYYIIIIYKFRITIKNEII